MISYIGSSNARNRSPKQASNHLKVQQMTSALGSQPPLQSRYMHADQVQASSAKEDLPSGGALHL